jgi:hypothetical protein
VASKKQRTTRYAASRPTVDEYVSTRERVNRASADFLKIDVDTALTFLQIASQTEDGVRRQRNLEAARRAYNTVLRLMERVTLSEQDTQILSLGLEELRFKLQQFGEVF